MAIIVSAKPGKPVKYNRLDIVRRLQLEPAPVARINISDTSPFVDTEEPLVPVEIARVIGAAFQRREELTPSGEWRHGAVGVVA